MLTLVFNLCLPVVQEPSTSIGQRLSMRSTDYSNSLTFECWQIFYQNLPAERRLKLPTPDAAIVLSLSNWSFYNTASHCRRVVKATDAVTRNNRSIGHRLSLRLPGAQVRILLAFKLSFLASRRLRVCM